MSRASVSVLLLFFAGVSWALDCDPAITKHDALLIIDVQNDFLPERPLPLYMQPNYVIPDSMTRDGSIRDGAVPIAHGADVVHVLNRWIDTFTAAGGAVMASLDWHPADSCSFCSADPWSLECRNLGPRCDMDPTSCPESAAPSRRCQDPVSVQDFAAGVLAQWPPHCVQAKFGARFDPFLRIPRNALVVKKGFLHRNDSYSAYGGRLTQEPYPFDTNGTEYELAGQPSLKELLEEREIHRLFVTGLATDFCVKNTILDSLGANAEGGATRPRFLDHVVLVQAAARGVNSTQVDDTLRLIQQKGAVVLDPVYAVPEDAMLAVCKQISPKPAPGDSSDWTLTSTEFFGLVGAACLFLLLSVVLMVCCRSARTQVHTYARSIQQAQEVDYRILHEPGTSVSHRSPTPSASRRASNLSGSNASRSS